MKGEVKKVYYQVEFRRGKGMWECSDPLTLSEARKLANEKSNDGLLVRIEKIAGIYFKRFDDFQVTESKTIATNY